MLIITLLTTCCRSGRRQKLYTNRGQWQRAPQYAEFKKPYALLKDKYGLYCEMVKWGEMKALISGITSIQGTSPDQTCFRTLIRNVENESELGARLRTSEPLSSISAAFVKASIGPRPSHLLFTWRKGWISNPATNSRP